MNVLFNDFQSMLLQDLLFDDFDLMLPQKLGFSYFQLIQVFPYNGRFFIFQKNEFKRRQCIFWLLETIKIYIFLFFSDQKKIIKQKTFLICFIVSDSTRLINFIRNHSGVLNLTKEKIPLMFKRGR